MQEFLLSQFLDYDHRKTEINKFNKQNRWRKRGISIVPLIYPLEYLGNFCAMVCIYHGDGTAIVTHGGIECGQGINTKVKLKDIVSILDYKIFFLYFDSF